jgi:hypothetical protein
LRVLAWQQSQLVVTIDQEAISTGAAGAQNGDGDQDRPRNVDGQNTADLMRLLRLVEDESIATTLIVSTSTPATRLGLFPTFTALLARLSPLTRGEADGYVGAKIRDAGGGRDRPAFSSRAVSRLHALAAGLPRRIDHLASLALMVGATRQLDAVDADVVDDVQREFALTNPR